MIGFPRRFVEPSEAVAIPTVHSVTGSRILSRVRICCVMAIVTREELDAAAKRMDRARRELVTYIKRSECRGFDSKRQKLADNLKVRTEEYWSLVSQLK